MVVVWSVVGAIVLAVLVVGALLDRAARARGSQLRDAGEMSAAERELRRSARGSRFGPTPGMDTWRRPDKR
jgi:hypothetical protein